MSDSSTYGEPPKRRKRRLRWLAAALLLSLIGFIFFLAGLHGWAYYQLRLARQDLEHYRLTQARQRLQFCRKAWPNDPETCFLAAQTARRLGDRDEAVHLLADLGRLAVVPKGVQVENALLQAQFGNLHVANSFWPLLEDNPAEAPLMLEAMYNGYAKHERWPEALRAAGKLTTLQRDNPRAWFWHGYVLDQTNELAAARESYFQALALDPDDNEARLRLAFVALSMNRFLEATEFFERVRQHRPDDFGVLGGLACCMRCLGRHEEALELLERVLAEKPDLTPALAERGRLALDMGDPAEAEPWLRRALHQNHYHSETNYNLFVCLGQLGRAEEAGKLGERIRHIEDREARLRALYKQIALKPRDLAMRSEAGALSLQTGRKEQGLRMLANVIQEDPRHAPTHKTLAEFYQSSGDPDQAARHRQLAGGQ